MKRRDEFLDFIGGEQKRPLLGLTFIIFGIVLLTVIGDSFAGFR